LQIRIFEKDKRRHDEVTDQNRDNYKEVRGRKKSAGLKLYQVLDLLATQYSKIKYFCQVFIPYSRKYAQGFAF
jgi:hypothetical protein